jgi:lipid II:glycine glycyltransferase (peptidoglycan interpeptide bridge formation enzyme)
MQVFLAEMNGKPVSAILASSLGESCVGIVGGTTDLGAKNYASYVVYWSIITSCQERQLSWFDLAGIDKVGNQGVYNFKKGTGGIELSAAGPFDCAPGGIAANVTRAAVSARDWLR